VGWVWDTVPKDLSVLQLGNPLKGKRPPKNVKVKHVSRESMPKAMSKCHVGIAPYNRDDSCPRVVSEFLACGLPVVARDSLQIWGYKYPVILADKAHFWDQVRTHKAYSLTGEPDHYSEMYEKDLSLPVAAKYLKTLIRSIEHE